MVIVVGEGKEHVEIVQRRLVRDPCSPILRPVDPTANALTAGDRDAKIDKTTLRNLYGFQAWHLASQTDAAPHRVPCKVLDVGARRTFRELSLGFLAADAVSFHGKSPLRETPKLRLRLVRPSLLVLLSPSTVMIKENNCAGRDCQEEEEEEVVESAD